MKKLMLQWHMVFPCQTVPCHKGTHKAKGALYIRMLSPSWKSIMKFIKQLMNESFIIPLPLYAHIHEARSFLFASLHQLIVLVALAC